MQFRVPVIYDRVMDGIAMILFPSRRYLNLTLACYLIGIAVGLVWFTGNWLWAPGVLLCAVFAWMMQKWM